MCLSTGTGCRPLAVSVREGGISEKSVPDWDKNQNCDDGRGSVFAHLQESSWSSMEGDNEPWNELSLDKFMACCRCVPRLFVFGKKMPS